MTSPEVLGVVFKEHGIEFFTETVNIEILEGVFRAFVDQAREIAEADLHRLEKTHVHEKLRL